jgi:hypothetical protein
MIVIQPYVANDTGAIAEQLEVWTSNPTDVSIDAVWVLSDSEGQYVNDGRMQLAGDDFAAWQLDIKYAEQYVIKTKGITVITS